MSILTSKTIIAPPNIAEYTSLRLKRAIAAVDEREEAFYYEMQLGWIFSQARQHLFGAFRNHFTHPKFVVETQVKIDGMGDWAHAVSAARTLKDAFPQAKVTLIANFLNYSKRCQLIDRGSLVGIEVMILQESASSVESAAAKAKKCYDEAEFVLELPCGGAGVVNPQDISDKHDAIKEYGFMPFQSMGLGPYDFGLQLPEQMPEAVGLDHIQDSSLKQLLQQTPGELYFGYVKSANDLIQQAFVALCVMTAQSKTVHVVCPLQAIQSETSSHINFDLAFFAQLGVKELILYQKNEKKESRVLAPDGKTVNIINSFPLVHGDMRVLQKLSHRIAGCTGDASFSEVVLEKVPFYEIRSHKLSFFKSLINLCEEQFGDKAPLTMFFKKVLELNEQYYNFKDLPTYLKTVKTCGEHLKSHELYEQMGTLSQIIKTHYGFKNVLVEIALGTMALQKFPELGDLSKKLHGDFKSGKKPLAECVEELSKAVQSFSSPQPVPSQLGQAML